jgi:hypothetical protein
MGLYFGLSVSQIAKGIESYKPSNNRSEVIKKESILPSIDAIEWSLQVIHVFGTAADIECRIIKVCLVVDRAVGNIIGNFRRQCLR